MALKKINLLFSLIIFSAQISSQNFTSYSLTSYSCGPTYKPDTITYQCYQDTLKINIIKYGQACPLPKTTMNLTADTIKILIQDIATLICLLDCSFQYNYTLYNLLPKKYIIQFLNKEYLIDCLNSTGVNEFSEINFLKIAPNPVSDKLHFTFDNYYSVDLKLKIINTLGQILYSENNFDLKKEIDLSFLKSGIYYLKLEGLKTQKTFKLVKE